MQQPPWSRERIVTAIASFHQRHQRWPVTPDFRPYHGLPSVPVVWRLFPTLDAARQAAGMPPDALPRRGAAFEAAWAGTQAQGHEVTHHGEEP